MLSLSHIETSTNVVEQPNNMLQNTLANTLDELSLVLQNLHPQHSRICSTSRDIDSHYRYKYQNLRYENETALVLQYLHSEKPEDNEIPEKLINWNNHAEDYLEKMKQYISNIIDKQKTAIRDSTKNMQRVVEQKIHKKRMMKKIDECQTKIELEILQNINNILPMELVRHIYGYAFTNRLRYIMYKLPETKITTNVSATKLTILKTFLKIIRRRALKIHDAIRREVISATGFLKNSDISDLHNIYGNTKSEITKTLVKTIQCYEYVLNITKHQRGCYSIATKIRKELISIYQSIAYICRPQFNQRAKPARRIRTTPQNQATQPT